MQSAIHRLWVSGRWLFGVALMLALLAGLAGAQALAGEQDMFNFPAETDFYLAYQPTTTPSISLMPVNGTAFAVLTGSAFTEVAQPQACVSDLANGAGGGPCRR
jgi:hypothetical protein